MLDSFLNLGSNRAFGWQIALILFCPVLFADFGVSDSATLNQIAIDVAHAANASQGADASLVDIRSDTAALTHDVYQAQQNLEVMQGYLYRLSNTGLRSITNGIWGIFEKLNTDSQRHLSGPDTSTYHDSIYVHDVRNDDIFWKLGDLQESINNLTNYFSNSDTTPYFAVGNLAYYGSTYLNDMATTAKLTVLFRTVFGRDPTSSELTRFKNYMQNYGYNLSFIQEYLGDFPNLPIFEQYNGFYDTSHTLAQRYDFADKAYDSMVASYATGTVRDFGQMKYLAYGTRDLTDTSIGISNNVSYLLVCVSNLNSQVSNAFVSVSGSLADSHVQVINEAIQRPIEYNQDTGKVENNSTVVQTVSDVADDWFGTLPSISTNIVAADTNTINNIQDNDYSASLNSVSGATPDSKPGYFSDTLEEINTKSDNFSTDFASILEESPEEFKFSFDLSGFQLGQEQRRDASPFLCEILVSDVKETTNDYVEFFCDFLDGFLCLYFAGLLWNLIYDSKAGTW